MIGSTIHEFLSVTSTNDLGKSGAEQDVDEGTVYLADHQTAGRGRRGATWDGARGESVLMSIVLYPQMPIDTVWQVGWAASVAIADALSSFGVTAQCKWPNDVVVGEEKIAGVLVETVPRQDSSYSAILGIGINVNQENFDQEESYRLPPTSILKITGARVPEVRQVAEKVAESMNFVYADRAVLWPEVAAWYRDLLIKGERQKGLDVETGRALFGLLMDVRESDGAGLLSDSSYGTRFVFPEY